LEAQGQGRDMMAFQTWWILNKCNDFGSHGTTARTGRAGIEC